MASSGTRRLFVAVLLPDQLKSKIGEVISRLSPLHGGVSWVNKENLHITLKFLGNTGESDIESVCTLLAAEASNMRPFEAVASGFGAFPNLRRPKVYWIGIESGAQSLKAVSRSVETSLEKLGMPDEDRFKAHITIGRVRDNRSANDLFLSESRAVGRLASFPVESFCLMESILRPHGALYSEVMTFKFGA